MKGDHMSNITDLLNMSLNRIREMIDANTIVGKPLIEQNIIIIPISKLNLGFISGGSDIKPNSNKEDVLFGGGAGGGVKITPVAFLVIQNQEVKLLSIDDNTHLAEKIIDLVDASVNKCKTLFKNNAPVEKI